MQSEIDAANAEFWNTLCGTTTAMCLGIKDHGPESLKRFDDEYFSLYPYLLPIVGPRRMRRKKVLEIGLGYGTLGQKIAEAGAIYSGLDIAENPVKMMNHRLRMSNLPGQAVQGSSLEMPFPDQTFDHVVSIGCFHHTGNVQRCIDETHRVLKQDGSAVLMVYNKFSWRQWTQWPRATLKDFVKEVFATSSARRGNTEQCAAYDPKPDGEAAPETVFSSKKDLRTALRQFDSVQFLKRNCDNLTVFGKILVRRKKLLPIVGPLLGLDIYLEAKKAA